MAHAMGVAPGRESRIRGVKALITAPMRGWTKEGTAGRKPGDRGRAQSTCSCPMRCPAAGCRRSGTPPEVVLRDGLDYQLVVADGQPVAGETTFVTPRFDET